jgi:hypothetical protein
VRSSTRLPPPEVADSSIIGNQFGTFGATFSLRRSITAYAPTA